LSFINAAKMSDDILFKVLMYGLSTFPGWSRINDNDHYLSQVVLGWSLAYLAATAVDNSEHAKRQFTIVPLAMDGGMGVGAMCQW
jgi:membrane-associated phospholipid phosphatase